MNTSRATTILSHALALFGDDDNLDPALLNIEDAVCRIALGEYDLVLAKFNNGFAFAHLGEKFLEIKSRLTGAVRHGAGWSLAV